MTFTNLSKKLKDTSWSMPYTHPQKAFNSLINCINRGYYDVQISFEPHGKQQQFQSTKIAKGAMVYVIRHSGIEDHARADMRMEEYMNKTIGHEGSI
jgi:hypothetical protein